MRPRSTWWVLALLGAWACGGKEERAPNRGTAGTSSVSGAAGVAAAAATAGSSAAAAGAPTSGGAPVSTAGGSAGGAGKSGAAGGGTTAGGASGGGGFAGGGAGGTGGTASSSLPPWPYDYPIDPAALTGCRDPQAAGCAECCVAPEGQSTCTRFSVGAGSTWWNVATGASNCSGCMPCASCSSRAEQSLREREPPSDCDCDTVKPVNDPCFAGTSCACFCYQLKALVEDCPPAP